MLFPWPINLFSGSINLPMAVAGNVAGGLIMGVRRLNVKSTIVLVICALLVTAVCVASLLVLGCKNESIVGINYNNS